MWRVPHARRPLLWPSPPNPLSQARPPNRPGEGGPEVVIPLAPLSPRGEGLGVRASEKLALLLDRHELDLDVSLTILPHQGETSDLADADLFEG